MRKSRAASAADTLQAHLGYWLRLVSNQVSGGFSRALQVRDLSVAEWVVLNQISAGDAVNPATVATATGMTRGAISKILDKLEQKKWIAREASDADHRVQCLSLTGQGRRVLPQLTHIADDNDERFFGALDAAERAALRGLLQKVAATHQITSIPVE